jgi:hypothetical protein
VTTVPPPKVVKTYDPEITASLVTKARLLVATPDGAFSAPDVRAVDLAIRLVAPGPKACAVSASECQEITKAVIAAYDRSSFPIKAHEAITALVDQLESAGLEVKARELRSQLELASMISLCDKAQCDRDFFRSQAEERGRELRDAMSGAAQLTARHNRTTDELHACRKLRDEALEKCANNEHTIVKLTLRVKQLETASKPAPKKPQRAGLRKKT